jgi:hypothetical protein
MTLSFITVQIESVDQEIEKPIETFAELSIVP